MELSLKMCPMASMMWQINLGDARNNAYSNIITFQNAGTPTDTVATSSHWRRMTKTYQVAVTNGQLDLDIAATGGNFAVPDGMTVAHDATPFTVSPSSPTTVTNTFSSITLAFSRPVTGHRAKYGQLHVDQPEQRLDHDHWRGARTDGNSVTLSFANQSTAGMYTLTAGTGIQDMDGDHLSSTQIVYTEQTTTIPSKYDFGGSTSPIAAGYTGVAATAFSANLGYGWLASSAAVGTLDTGITTFTTPDANLTRNLNYTTNGDLCRQRAQQRTLRCDVDARRRPRVRVPDEHFVPGRRRTRCKPAIIRQVAEQMRRSSPRRTSSA